MIAELSAYLFVSFSLFLFSLDSMVHHLSHPLSSILVSPALSFYHLILVKPHALVKPTEALFHICIAANTFGENPTALQIVVTKSKWIPDLKYQLSHPYYVAAFL